MVSQDGYRDNELIGEYLGGVDESEYLRPRLLNSDVDPLAAYVPCNMAAGEGVRISVSYHLPPDNPHDGVMVHPMDTFGTDEERSDVVEADTFEVVKLLRRKGIAVTVPDAVGRLAYEDTSANLAMLVHGGDTAAELAMQTLSALATLCKVWVSRGDDRIVSFNVGVLYSDRCVRFSFAGHVVDLDNYFQRFGMKIPSDPSAIPGWIEDAYACVSAIAPEAQDQPPLDWMLQQTGILLFERKLIPDNLYQLTINEKVGPEVQFAIPKNETALIELLETEKLTWSPLHLVEESICSVCKLDYLACDCSKYLDTAVHQEMKKAPIAGLFWTNRAASARIRLQTDNPRQVNS